jgi:hypothetical protein
LEHCTDIIVRAPGEGEETLPIAAADQPEGACDRVLESSRSVQDKGSPCKTQDLVALRPMTPVSTVFLLLVPLIGWRPYHRSRRFIARQKSKV